MKRALIVGAGGFGREVLVWLDDLRRCKGGFEIEGFLDRDPTALGHVDVGLPILGDPAVFELSKDHILVSAIGDPASKLKLADALAGRGGRWMSLVHPTAVIGPRCTLGEGCVLCPGAVLTTDVILGRLVTINVNSTVGHDAIIGDGCTLSAHCDVTGHVTLERCVFMGSHAATIPGITVGECAKIGAGSIAVRDVAKGNTVFGVPAKVVFELYR
jgi:sugar O-acyltransferase (sialic acid O-acetyltransferase NeuD family)